jgi:hypothetical protein
MQHKSGEAVPRDTLASQMDFLDAQFQSMDTKVAVLAVEKPKQENKEQIDNLNENVRSSFHSALDALHHLTLSLEHAQMLSLIHCLRNKNECQLFFHLQLRHDALLSQVKKTIPSHQFIITYPGSDHNCDSAPHRRLYNGQ